MPRTANSPLIRRMRDSEGNLVTYLCLHQACQVAGLSETTILRWTEQGLVRCTGRLQGGRNYAVVDIARLKLMSRNESLALGIRRTPERHIRQQHAWSDAAYQRTRPRAVYHGEEWDSYDMQFLIDSMAAGTKVTLIALALGRTYSAVENRITHLRSQGEIPAQREEDPDWRQRTLSILTTDEIATLLDRTKAVAA